MEYKKPKVNIHHAVLYFAQQQGLSVEFICNQLNMDLEFLIDKNQTMNTDQIIKFWYLANNFTGLNRPGLDFSKNVKLTYVGLMGELFSKLETAYPLIPITCSVKNIITEMIDLDYSENSDTLTLHINPQGIWKEIDIESSNSACEYVIGNYFQIFNQLLNKQIRPYQVGISPSKNSVVEEYQAYFKTDIVFGDQFFICYKKSDLHQEISTKNKKLHAHYLHMCELQQKDETQGNSLKAHIENIIFYTRWPNIPSGEEMASYLFMTYKQLQRKLKKEDISYRKLINQIKSKYATQMIKSNRFKATEISDILNYSDLSALSRAFKEHNGLTIQEYKNQLSIPAHLN
jgi:AraC-like DNA-binding protein